jgi:uncharacterized protein YggE
MKNKVLLALGIMMALVLVSLVGCSAGGVQAADVQPVNVNMNSQHGIWVNGVGKVTVTPDIATISVGVSAKADKVADAQAQASAAMDKVMAALTAAGIDKKDIQTQYYSIQQLNRWDDKTQTTVITGYEVSNTVSVKVRAVEKTGSVIDAVAAAGSDNIRINGISFSVDKPEQYYAQAREAAMKDAKAKAEDLARLSNVTLGKAFYITESNYSQPVPYPMYAYKGMDSAAGAAPTTAISAGETDITLNVQVAYSIQ